MIRLSRLALAAVLAAGAASAAFASGPRLFALGGDGAYLEDAANARVWYGSLADEGGWVAVESGVFDQVTGYGRSDPYRRVNGPSAGAYLPLGKDGHIGTAALWWDDRAANGGIGELSDDGLTDAWQLMFARRVGRVTGAFSIRHADGLIDDSAIFYRAETMRDEFGLGLRIDLAEKAYLDVAGEFVRLEEDPIESDSPIVNTSNAGSHGLRARTFLQLDDGLVLVPMVAYQRELRGVGGGADDELRWRLWRLGAGLTWYPDPDHFVLLTLDRRDARHDYKSSSGRDESDVWNVRLAVEARIHALLSVRLSSGYRHTAGQYGGQPKYHYVNVPLSLGLAVHAGPVDLDLGLANLPPVGPDGLVEPLLDSGHSTWMNAGLSWWF